MDAFRRPHAARLAGRLAERRRFIQVVAGPRQVGKTTLVRQVLERTRAAWHFASADDPALKGSGWIEQQWEAGRLLPPKGGGPMLVLDEIQKVAHWPEVVKRLWDEDAAARRPLKVVLLGAAPLLIQKGLTESLAGRFEVLHLPHWSYEEMRDCFGFGLDRYLFHGGYPGAAPLARDHARWVAYMKDSLIETTISRDVLLLTRVDKPALLRRLFQLSCSYSGQILSFTKMLGPLHEAGNTTTLAHYLDLLEGAGMVRGLPKFAGAKVRQRGSIPKLQVFNTALLTAQSGLTLPEAKANREFWGRLVESAIGAHLANAAAAGTCELFYWRDNNLEVDFVTRAGRFVTAIEVKSARTGQAGPGIDAFSAAFRPQRKLLVGGDGIKIDEFLLAAADRWTRS